MWATSPLSILPPQTKNLRRSLVVVCSLPSGQNKSHNEGSCSCARSTLVVPSSRSERLCVNYYRCRCIFSFNHEEEGGARALNVGKLISFPPLSIQLSTIGLCSIVNRNQPHYLHYDQFFTSGILLSHGRRPRKTVQVAIRE